jgi:hypothetical protein
MLLARRGAKCSKTLWCRAASTTRDVRLAGERMAVWIERFSQPGLRKRNHQAAVVRPAALTRIPMVYSGQ